MHSERVDRGGRSEARYVVEACEDGHEGFVGGEGLANGADEDTQVVGVGGGGDVREGEIDAVRGYGEIFQGFRGRCDRKCHVCSLFQPLGAALVITSCQI